VPNFNYRYLTEDVPYGLAVVRAIAELAGVQTPAIDAVLRWTADKTGKEYFRDDKLAGSDARELPIPQNHAIDSLTKLVDWYASWS
jgi:hypothetical protein